MAGWHEVTDKTIAVVAAQNAFAEDYWPCETGADIELAQQEMRANGSTPVVFYREGHGPEGNRISGSVTGLVVQARDIDGGVRLG